MNVRGYRQVEEVLLNSVLCRRGERTGAAFRSLAALKVLLGHSGARARQVAAILDRKKCAAFCCEMPDVCDAKRPLTILSILESVADGQFQAQRGPPVCAGFGHFLSCERGCWRSALLMRIRPAEYA